MQLVGRECELAIVDRAVEHARAGGGRVLGVLGEPGIGKTALLGAVTALAEQAGMIVLHGRGVEHEREVPFGVVVDAFDERVAALHPARITALGGELAGVLPAVSAGGAAWPARGAGPAERVAAHRALRALLEQLGRERPVALVLDDLQWADEPSLELVLHLLRRPPATSLLLAFASRCGGPAPRLLDAARSTPGFEQLSLEPLGHEASLRLLAEVADPAARARVARQACGNPFFLRELGRAADRSGDTLPDTVLAAVQLELATLPGTSRALLDGAAVAGDGFDLELAAAAAGVTPDPAGLDALAAANVIRAKDGGPEFVFRHALIRRVVYDAAPPAWRLGAHRRAAVELERRGARASVCAYHVARHARPGDVAAIALLCEAAAEVADTAPTVAARSYQAALRLVPDRNHRRRATLLVPLADALGAAGRLEESRDALVEALALVGRDQPGRRLDVAVACARAETRLGRHEDACRRLLALRSGAPRSRHAELAFELAAGAFHQGQIGELRRWADPALAAAIEAGDPRLRAGAAALAALGALWTGEPGRAATCLDDATALVGALDDEALATHLAVLYYVGVAQHLCERLPMAAATSARALAICRRTARSDLLVGLLGLRAIVALQMLELDLAVHEAGVAEEVARLQRVPELLHLALWILSLVHDQRGERAEAERAAHEGARLTGRLESSKLTRTAACEFAAILADREPARAARDMTAAGGPCLEHVDPTWTSWLLLRLVRAKLATGAIDEAEHLARHAATVSARLGLVAAGVRAACAGAETLLARDRAEQAAALAHRACVAAEGAAAPLDALQARLVEGRALATAGHARAAKAALQQAASDAGDTGARRVHGVAAQQLRRLGSRASDRHRRRAPSDPHEPLTTRERAVAELVAQGHSNKQVAATLYLSDKTVANTLTRVYAKLGVHSRSQLTRVRAGDGGAGA